MKPDLLIFLAFSLLLQLNVVNVSSYEWFDVPMELYVDPERSVVWVGSVFIVNVSAVNVSDPGLWAYEFKLYYYNTVLEGLNVTLPKGHFLSPQNSEKIWTECEINQSGGYAFVVVSLRGPELTKRGNGTLITITFEAKSLGNSTLDIRDCNFVSDVSRGWGEAPHTICNGLVEVVPPEDLNLDGEINIKDLALMGLAFGSYPGHARWNPTADVNKDDVINILDLVSIARNFGKTL